MVDLLERLSNSNGEGVAGASNEDDELNCQSSSNAPELNNCTSGSSENWMVLSISGEKPTPRFNHAAAVIGNKMVVVGGESANGLLEDVQMSESGRGRPPNNLLRGNRSCTKRRGSSLPSIAATMPSSIPDTPISLPACATSAPSPALVTTQPTKDRMTNEEEDDGDSY